MSILKILLLKIGLEYISFLWYNMDYGTRVLKELINEIKNMSEKELREYMGENKMEYTFVKPIDTKTGVVYDWCLKISDIETLFMYEHRVTSNNSKDYKSIGNMMLCLKNEGYGFFNKAGEGRLKALENFGTIYIQKSNGYFTHSSSIKIVEEKVCSKIIYP